MPKDIDMYISFFLRHMVFVCVCVRGHVANCCDSVGMRRHGIYADLQNCPEISAKNRLYSDCSVSRRIRTLHSDGFCHRKMSEA